MNDARPITAPIPIERELEERLSSFVRLRWLAVSGIFAGTWISIRWIGADYSPWPLGLTGAAVAAYNGVFHLLRGRIEQGWSRHYRGFTYAQMGLDWIALTCLVHYTGGLESPVALAFVFHIVIGALLLSRRAAYLQAAAAAVLLAAMVAAEEAGGWPPVTVSAPEPLATTGGGVSALRWLLLAAFFGITSALTGSIARRLRAKERALVDSEISLDRAYREMEALHELGQAAHATFDLDQVLALFAESATRLMGAKGCSIGLLDESGGAVEHVASYGLSEEYLAKGPVVVARSPMVAQALDGEVVEIDDITADDRLQYAERARREGIRSILCVSLTLRDGPIGVLRVYADTPGPVGGREVSFLRNLANLAAVAIQSTRAYAESQALSDERAWFARTTHHQLRAPLAALRGLLEALPYAGDLNVKQADLVARTAGRADELLALVEDLLELAHAQRPSRHLQPAPVPLASGLARALETAAQRAETKHLALEVAGLEGARVAVEAGDVHRIFANLLENAVKYTPAGGKVTVRAESREGRVCVHVCDTGIGIAEAERERVFQGFHRTEAAKATGEYGTGVGLSIVRRLVQRWHGSLDLQSAVGEGSCFTVCLPAADGPGADTSEAR